MITKEMLDDLDGEKLLVHTMDAEDIYDTLQALLRVARAAEHYLDPKSGDGLEKDLRLREALAALKEPK